jgi:ribosomal protein L13
MGLRQGDRKNITKLYGYSGTLRVLRVFARMNEMKKYKKKSFKDLRVYKGTSKNQSYSANQPQSYK